MFNFITDSPLAKKLAASFSRAFLASLVLTLPGV